MTTPETDRNATLVRAPRRLPLLGHAWQLRYWPLRFLDSLRNRADLVQMRLGPIPAYLVNNPQLVQELLVTRHNEFTKTGSPLWDRVRILVGNGLGTSEGATHLAQRRLLQPLFHQDRLATYIAIMTEVAGQRADSWTDGQLLAVDQEMYNITASTMSRCMYSGKLSREAVAEIITWLPVALAGVGRRAAMPVPWLHDLPTREHRRFTTSVHRLHALVDQLIADHQDGDQTDAISVLLAVRDEQTGQTMSPRQVHDEVMTLLVAGTDITASLLAWALHLLGSHPNAEQRVHAELDTVLAGRSPTVADLPRLECLAQVLSETLRLYPPAWLLPRRAAINTTLGGHTIRRGSYVFYSPYLSHHDPLQFPDPDRFDPDRWLPERTRDLSRYAHIPFGAGPHKCIGNSFSVIEAQTALATIMTRWRLRPSKNHPLRPHVFTSLTPGWLRMITERR